MQTKTGIGWIGTGKLGTAIVNCLLSKKIKVSVFNRTYLNTIPLIEQGAIWVNSPKELAAQHEYIIICVTAGKALEDILFNEDTGLISSKHNALKVINCGTVSYSTAKFIASRMEQENIIYIDAPVSGGIIKAREGTLTALISGQKYNIKLCRPMLEEFCEKIVELVGEGNAQLMKILNNAAEIAHLVIATDLIQVCNKLNIKLEDLYSVITSARGFSTYMALLLEKIISKNEETHSTLLQRIQDIENMLDICDIVKYESDFMLLCREKLCRAVELFDENVDQSYCAKTVKD